MNNGKIKANAFNEQYAFDFNSVFYDSNNLKSKARLSNEIQIFTCVYYGDIDKLTSLIKSMSNKKLFVGKLSDNSLQQAKYLAVSFAAIACRVAMFGGICENEAYEFGDSFINSIDSIDNTNTIYRKIQDAIREITEMVHESNCSNTYSPTIRNCTNYIHNHLTDKISLDKLAHICNLTPSYLSALFKKETNITISEYIIKLKMREAATLIISGEHTCSEVSNMLGFCSQSYFCKCFKNEFHVTPLEYIEKPFFRNPDGKFINFL